MAMRLSRALALGFVPLLLAGCSERGSVPPAPNEGAKPAEGRAAKGIKALETVTLSDIRAVDLPSSQAVRVQIAASGPFASNAVRKSDPERLILIVHNARAGSAPPLLKVNDGTITRVETVQLDTGKSPAVRITVGLSGDTAYQVIPDQSAIMVDIKRR